jgi:hypothetical protein
VTVADKRHLLQMWHCNIAAHEKLNSARMDADTTIVIGLIMPFGGSDGFFHFCLRILEQYPEQAANLQLDSFKKLRCSLPAISVLFFYRYLFLVTYSIKSHGHSRP